MLWPGPETWAFKRRSKGLIINRDPPRILKRLFVKTSIPSPLQKVPRRSPLRQGSVVITWPMWNQETLKPLCIEWYWISEIGGTHECQTDWFETAAWNCRNEHVKDEQSCINMHPWPSSMGRCYQDESCPKTSHQRKRLPLSVILVVDVAYRWLCHQKQLHKVPCVCTRRFVKKALLSCVFFLSERGLLDGNAAFFNNACCSIVPEAYDEDDEESGSPHCTENSNGCVLRLILKSV